MSTRDHDTTTLGTFAQRQLRHMEDTAKAGAMREAGRLAEMAQAIAADVRNGTEPNVDIVGLASDLDRWLSELHAMREIREVLNADKTEMTRRDEPREPYRGPVGGQGGMHKIKVRFSGMGRPKTLTYQTAREVSLDEQVEVPRWPDMKPGPPLRGTVVSLTSDYAGQAVTIVGG